MMLDPWHVSGGRRTAGAALGGSSGPEWLPDGATLFADFTAGHYYADGASTTFDAVFTEHASWGSPTGSELLSASGLAGPAAPVIQGSLVAPYLEGFVLELETEISGVSGAINVGLQQLPDYTADLFVLVGTDNVQLKSFAGGVVTTLEGESPGVHTVRATFTVSGLTGRLDDGPDDAIALLDPAVFTVIGLSISGDHYLRTLTIFPLP